MSAGDGDAARPVSRIARALVAGGGLHDPAGAFRARGRDRASLVALLRALSKTHGVDAAVIILRSLAKDAGAPPGAAAAAGMGTLARRLCDAVALAVARLRRQAAGKQQQQQQQAQGAAPPEGSAMN